ncbi:MAG TPA: DUF2889 domain-containing protein [Alphaproteobacteria bacterium]
MPLPEPAPREHIHTRTIECTGFRRADGLWDIDGRLTDTKTYAFSNRWRGELAPGEPVHDMRIRLTIDDDMVIRAVAATTEASPFEICPEVAPRLEVLAGERVGEGWSRTVRRLVGGSRGCTHLTELLGRMATAAYQTIWPLRASEAERRGVPAQSEPPRRLVDSCHAWRSDGPVMAELYPDYAPSKPRAAGD